MPYMYWKVLKNCCSWNHLAIVLPERTNPKRSLESWWWAAKVKAFSKRNSIYSFECFSEWILIATAWMSKVYFNRKSKLINSCCCVLFFSFSWWFYRSANFWLSPNLFLGQSTAEAFGWAWIAGKWFVCFSYFAKFGWISFRLGCGWENNVHLRNGVHSSRTVTGKLMKNYHKNSNFFTHCKLAALIKKKEKKEACLVRIKLSLCNWKSAKFLLWQNDLA